MTELRPILLCCPLLLASGLAAAQDPAREQPKVVILDDRSAADPLAPGRPFSPGWRRTLEHYPMAVEWKDQGDFPMVVVHGSPSRYRMPIVPPRAPDQGASRSRLLEKLRERGRQP